LSLAYIEGLVRENHPIKFFKFNSKTENRNNAGLFFSQLVELLSNEDTKNWKSLFKAGTGEAEDNASEPTGSSSSVRRKKGACTIGTVLTMMRKKYPEVDRKQVVQIDNALASRRTAQIIKGTSVRSHADKHVFADVFCGLLVKLYRK
jgi:hypothetical protein